MCRDDDVDLLRSFLDTWPPGTHLTTRGMQIAVGLPSLAEADRAAEQLRALGLLDVERVGATRLWSRASADFPTAPPH
ncbi:MAG: hypothetical protein ACRDJE_26155 [Dehalococcoidia bacterium]